MRSRYLVPLVVISLLVPGTSSAAPPEHDNFADARSIPAIPYSDTSTNLDASFELGEPRGCAGQEATVWYSFTPTETVSLRATTFGSTYDTILAAYRGPDLANLTLVACNDSYYAESQSRIAFLANAATTYYFQIGGWHGATGDLQFDIVEYPLSGVSGTVSIPDSTSDEIVCLGAYEATSGIWITDAILTVPAGGSATYSLSLDDGIYRITFTCLENSGFLTEWYNNKRAIEEADDVVVSGTIVSGIDAVIETSEVITGTVSIPRSTSAMDICVTAYSADFDHHASGTRTSVPPGGSGAYSIDTAIFPGNYKVHFGGCGPGSIVPEWYDGKRTFEEADPVAVSGEPTTGIDAVLEISGVITGNVSIPDSHSDLNICITAFNANDPFEPIGRTQTLVPAGGSSDYAISLGLASGVYKVQFSGCNGKVITEWYNDKPSYEAAENVTVSEGATTTAIDAVLASIGEIAGTITIPGSDSDHRVCIQAHSPDGFFNVWNRASTIVPAGGAGSYSIWLEPGQWKIRFSDCAEYELKTEWNNDKPSVDAADIVTVNGSVTTEVNAAMTLEDEGYWLVGSDGSVWNFGKANNFGSVSALRQPVVGMASTPTGRGYWLVAADGGIFSLGDAGFHGSTGGISLNQPIVGMASTPSGQGYWLVASDGGIFAFDDAQFFGSTGSMRLNQPIVGMASTPSGQGYWLVASDGGIFSFGDAQFFGSTGAIRLNQPVVGMAATPTGRGYWLVASDGGIFSFGDAHFYGSAGGIRLNRPIVAMMRTRPGDGYWLVASDGGVFSFGGAVFLGSVGYDSIRGGSAR